MASIVLHIDDDVDKIIFIYRLTHDCKDKGDAVNKILREAKEKIKKDARAKLGNI